MIASPVGPYYHTGFNHVSLYADTENKRECPGIPSGGDTIAPAFFFFAPPSPIEANDRSHSSYTCAFPQYEHVPLIKVIQRHATVLYLLLYGDWGPDRTFFPV